MALLYELAGLTMAGPGMLVETRGRELVVDVVRLEDPEAIGGCDGVGRRGRWEDESEFWEELEEDEFFDGYGREAWRAAGGAGADAGDDVNTASGATDPASELS